MGAESATRQGLNASLAALGQGIGGAQGEIDRSMVAASQPLQGFQTGGIDAHQLQAAQSGALGPEAQAQAMQSFQMSPGQQFLQGEAEKAQTRNASATGGLGGNNLKRALGRDAIAFGSQALGQQFDQLGQVAGRGFQAGGAMSGIQERGGQNLSQLALQGGVLPANLFTNAANTIGQQRFGVGQQLAQAASGTTTALANLQNQLGGSLAGVTGQQGTNLANLVSGTGQASSQLQQQLGMILANIGTGTGSQLANQTNLAGRFDAAGILGQNTAVQNALSSLIQAFPSSGGGGQSSFNSYGGYQPVSNQSNQQGTYLSGTQGQRVS
jgi:hypothetical protein